MASTPRRFLALIPAGGTGTRAGVDIPKQYAPINGEPMIVHAVRAFLGTDAVASVHVVLAPGDPWAGSPAALDLAASAGARLRLHLDGGATRAQTVANGLAALAVEAGDEDWVLVHDAARPCVTPALIASLIDALGDDRVGGLLAVPVTDTVKRADADHRVAATLAREGLWLAQTPQMFRLGLLRRAYRAKTDATDEAGAVEALGERPRLVRGSATNIKVTFAADFELASLYLAAARPAGPAQDWRTRESTGRAG